MTPIENASLHSDLTFRWEKTVEHLEAAWQECLGNHNVLGSFALQKTVEASQLKDVEHHYLVGEDPLGVVCLVPCFVFRVSMLTVAKPGLQRVVSAIRTFFPDFLIVRVLVVGSAISNYGDLLGFKDLDDRQRWSDVRILSVFNEIRSMAAALNVPVVLVKELEDDLKDRLKPVIGHLFFFADSLPSTCLLLPQSERGGYWASIRSKYRNKIKKRKMIGREKNLSWKISPVSGACSERIFDLYTQVVNHSAFVFERVNQSFFDKIRDAFPKNAFYIFGFIEEPEGKRQISCELILCDGNSMRLVYSGFDYLVKRDSDLYFNVFYAAIEEAEKLGLTEVHLGQTAYEVKAELGAQKINLSIAACHLNPILHSLLDRFKEVFFPKTLFPARDVFSVPPPKPKSGNPNRGNLPNIINVPLIAEQGEI